MKLFLLILLFCPTVSLAQTLIGDDDVNTGAEVQSATSMDTEELGETENFDSMGGGLQGTDYAQNAGSQVEIMGIVMGGAFLSQCGWRSPFPCVAAAMSFADAMAGRAASSAAYETGTYFDPSHGTEGDSSDFSNSTGVDIGSDGQVENDSVLAAQAQEGLNALADMGYTVNSDGSVTTPNGQTITKGDLASAESMQAVGATASQAAQFQKNLANFKKQAAKKAGVNLDQQAVAAAGANSGLSGGSQAGGDSGGASNYQANEADSIVEEIEYRHRGKKKRGLAEAEAAQLSTSFKGEPIGIPMANLFRIVHEKYKEKKRNRSEFINREY